MTYPLNHMELLSHLDLHTLVGDIVLGPYQKKL